MGFPVKPLPTLHALTILFLALPAGARESDDRPVYYVMLRALESRFVDYNTRVEADYQRKIEILTQDHVDRMQALDRERAALDAAWRDKQREHDRQRAELDEATATLNERIGDLHERWKTHDELSAEHDAARTRQSMLDAINETLARNTDTVRSLGRRYNERASAVQASRLALRDLTENYQTARHPTAQKLRGLSEEYRVFARDQNEAIESALSGYDRARDEFQRWLAGSESGLARLDEEVRETAHAYGLAKSNHDRLRDELAGLIERHNTIAQALNAGEVPADRREGTMSEMAELQGRIASNRVRLDESREEALKLLRAAESRRAEREEMRRQLERDKSTREQALAAERTRMQGKIEQLRSGLAIRRRATQTQVRALEEQMEAGLQSARARLEEQASELRAEFGEEFPELMRATMAWLETADPELLYHGDSSAPRFSRAAPAANAVYEAVEQIDARRNEAERIVGEVRTTGEAVAAADDLLTRQNQELKAQRARLANAYQSLRATERRRREEFRAAVDAWTERRHALVSERVKAVEAMKGAYEARLDLTGREFETLQDVLLAALGEERKAIAPDLDAAALRADLVRSTTMANLNPDASFLEQNALFHSVSTERAPRGDHTVGAKWVSYRGQPIAERRVLREEGKSALIRTWFDTLSSRAPLAKLRGKLLARLDDADDAQVDRFLAALFERGMFEYASLVEVRFEDGSMGAQAIILENRYWIAADGRLERIPEV